MSAPTADGDRAPVSMDRAAAVRHALVRMVAAGGFHGASMAAIAREAGVATGTAYVHYASKEALVHATYLQVKSQLVDAAVSRIAPDSSARVRFEQLWDGALDHLAEDPDRARFLMQVEVSPFADAAHEAALAADGDPLMSSPALLDLVAQLVPLPLPVLFDLAIGPVVRLVGVAGKVDPQLRPLLVEACWRAVTVGE